MNKILLIIALTIAVRSHYNLISYRLKLSTPPSSTKPANSQLLAQDLTDQQIVQDVFAGIFEQNNLPGPYMIKYCFDGQISHQVVVYITDLLAKSSKASLTGLLQLVQQTVDFYHSLPEALIDCLGRSQEITSLGFKYDIDGSIDFEALAKKVQKFMALNFLEVHKWTQDLNGSWLAQKYNITGYKAATYGHIIQNSKI